MCLWAETYSDSFNKYLFSIVCVLDFVSLSINKIDKSLPWSI